MFPISDIEKAGKFPFITYSIIAINIFVFIQVLLSQNPDQFVLPYLLIPENISFFNYETLKPFITSMFFHAGFMHIISNMWFLRIFGDNVEARLGIFGFTLLYLLSGLVGGFAQYILNPESNIPMLGASGAVSGVMGAYMVYFPHHRIRSLVFIFFFLTFINIPAGFYIFYWFIIQFFQGIASIPSLQEQMGGVAFFAHIGGFVTGFLIAKNFKQNVSTGYIEGEIID